jgi:5'-nucleotidase
MILLSRNTADTGLRVFNSIQHYQLPIVRAAFCGGHSPYPYASAFGCHLFLSTNADDVRHALENGLAAATFLPSSSQLRDSQEIRFAFDGDAVLFSDEAERIYKSKGLDAFAASEQAAAHEPLSGGPFKPFLQALQGLQAEFSLEACPIRTALVTARSAPAHERVIRTLRAWQIRIDESLFLGGLDKGEFLKAYGADVFFDDQQGHCLSASRHVPTGHVPHGVANE